MNALNSNLIKFKEYSINPVYTFATWSAPLYYADAVITLPEAITNQNRLFCISHDVQHFVIAITGTNGSSQVTIRVASLTSAYKNGYLTILYT